MAAPRQVLRRNECATTDVLMRIGDKWSVLVIALLGQGGHRFGELLGAIDGISQRMLTVTLRGLERDGLVTRTAHAVIPPRVDYALSPMGKTLLTTITELARWAEKHANEIGAARAAYDRHAERQRSARSRAEGNWARPSAVIASSRS